MSSIEYIDQFNFLFTFSSFILLHSRISKDIKQTGKYLSVLIFSLYQEHVQRFCSSSIYLI